MSCNDIPMKVSVGVILADQLTLFQPGGTDYPHLITTGTPGFSDLPTALPTKYLQLSGTGSFNRG